MDNLPMVSALQGVFVWTHVDCRPAHLELLNYYLTQMKRDFTKIYSSLKKPENPKRPGFFSRKKPFGFLQNKSSFLNIFHPWEGQGPREPSLVPYSTYWLWNNKSYAWVDAIQLVTALKKSKFSASLISSRLVEKDGLVNRRLFFFAGGWDKQIYY